MIKNPEAVFKMMYWSLQYTLENSNPERQNAMTEEEKQNGTATFIHGFLTVSTLPAYGPISVINKLAEEGKTEITDADAAKTMSSGAPGPPT